MRKLELFTAYMVVFKEINPLVGLSRSSACHVEVYIEMASAKDVL
jgi:hypothetical protein